MSETTGWFMRWQEVSAPYLHRDFAEDKDQGSYRQVLVGGTSLPAVKGWDRVVRCKETSM